MKTRAELLESLVRFEDLPEPILSALEEFGWESDKHYFIIARSHVLSILDRYLSNELTAQQVEAWANNLESREDVGFENAFEEILWDAIFKLANPTITQNITRDFAKQLKRQLTSYLNRAQ